MRSSVSWTIGLIHLTSLLTIPVAARKAIAQEYPSCFMITSSGRMLDLTELCQSLPPTLPAHSDTQRARTIRLSPATPANHYTQPTVGVRGSDDHWLSGLNMVRRYAPDQWSGYVLNRGPHGFEEPGRGDRRNDISGGSSGSSRSSGSSGSSGSGNCDNPWQLDARGRRCGRRAASERPGGR
jgi:hypothetical protein